MGIRKEERVYKEKGKDNNEEHKER